MRSFVDYMESEHPDFVLDEGLKDLVKKYCFEGTKKIITKPEVDQALSRVSHVATRSEYQDEKDFALKFLRRFPTHYEQILKAYKPLMDRDPNFFEINDGLYDPFDLIDRLKTAPILFENMPFYDTANKDWITRDRGNIKALKWFLSVMEPAEIKKMLSKEWGNNYDPRYKKFAQEELDARRHFDLLNHEIIV